MRCHLCSCIPVERNEETEALVAAELSFHEPMDDLKVLHTCLAGTQVKV